MDAWDWDYSGVPAWEHTWYVDLDPNLQCPSHKLATRAENGISYSGDCLHPNWGGGYGIGFQTFEAFLSEGPQALNLQMPATIEAEIRASLLAHRRPAPRTWVELGVALPDPTRRWLERVDAALDGVTLTTLRPEGRPTHHTFFVGAVQAGSHTVGAAVITGGEPPHIAYANNVTFSLASGESARVILTPEGRTAQVQITLLPPR